MKLRKKTTLITAWISFAAVCAAILAVGLVSWQDKNPVRVSTKTSQVTQVVNTNGQVDYTCQVALKNHSKETRVFYLFGEFANEKRTGVIKEKEGVAAVRTGKAANPILSLEGKEQKTFTLTFSFSAGEHPEKAQKELPSFRFEYISIP